MSRPLIVVLGAGVNGLSVAHTLLQRGARVELWSAARHPQVTSSVAAAFWSPFCVEQSPRVWRWASVAFRRFSALSSSSEDTGVVMRRVQETLAPASPTPPWLTGRPDLERRRVDDVSDVLEFTAPVIEIPRYLPWLEAQILAAGGVFRPRQLDRVEEALREADVVVNATGLGARELTGDLQLRAIRGQLLRVRCDAPGDRRVRLDERLEGRALYLVPREHDLIIGGTTEHSEDLAPNENQSEELLARAAPWLPGPPRSQTPRVGLRPYRPTIRLEREDTPTGPIVHCYGHGGAGVTLSWGCAEEVAELVDAVIPLTVPSRDGLSRGLARRPAPPRSQRR